MVGHYSVKTGLIVGLASQVRLVKHNYSISIDLYRHVIRRRNDEVLRDLVYIVYKCCLLSCDGDLNLHTWLDVDRGDLLDDLRWGVEVDQSLVDSHLVGVPGLGTLSVRCLSGGDFEDLGWESDWSLDSQFLALGSSNEVGADLLEVLDVSGSEGDSDSVDLWGDLLVLLSGFV